MLARLALVLVVAVAACDSPGGDGGGQPVPECAFVEQCWTMSGGYLCCTGPQEPEGEAVCLLVAHRVEEICDGDEPIEQPEPAPSE